MEVLYQEIEKARVFLQN